MLNLSDQEKGKVQNIVQDKILMEGLKKVFFNVFLEPNTFDEVNELAASMIAIHKLEQGFRVLTHMREEVKDEEIHENIV